AFSFKWVQLSDGWEAVLLATPATSAIPQPQVCAASDPMADALGSLTRAYIKKWGQADTLWRQKQRTQVPGLAFGESA
ncbi:MAG TPA: hypothetical protein VFL86_06180, partial [Burkholderiaceae bacterium]|nr:hypothetical protein [Burkholderiaceae bacterium]